MLALGAAGALVAIGALASRTTKARRVTGAVLGFSLLVAPLFLAWSISRPFRGPGYFAILIGAIALSLGGFFTIWLLCIFSQFAVLQCVPPIVTVVSARALEGARAIAETSPDADIYGMVQTASVGRTNTLATMSLIFSLLGVGVVGVILGHVARGQIRGTGEHGAGNALAGVIIGYVQAAMIALVVILFLVSALANQN